MNARDGQGGLIALSVSECEQILVWFWRAKFDSDAAMEDTDVDLKDRLVEWRNRHVPVGHTDGD